MEKNEHDKEQLLWLVYSLDSKTMELLFDKAPEYIPASFFNLLYPRLQKKKLNKKAPLLIYGEYEKELFYEINKELDYINGYRVIFSPSETDRHFYQYQIQVPINDANQISPQDKEYQKGIRESVERLKNKWLELREYVLS